MLTAWGYEIDAESIPPLLSAEAFNTMTGGKYSSDARVEQALAATSQAIRNACGWHVCPSLACTAQPTPLGGMLRLPANAVTAISSIAESSTALDSDAYEWRRDGLVRRVDGGLWSPSWGALEVDYTAGYAAAAVPDLADAVRAIAEGVLAVAVGVASESADGVSISYSANASSVAASLTRQQLSALAPYRLVSSHAA